MTPLPGIPGCPASASATVGPQVLQHRGQVVLELALGVPELLDLRKLIVQEDAISRCSSPSRDISTRIASLPFWTRTAVCESRR